MADKHEVEASTFLDRLEKPLEAGNVLAITPIPNSYLLRVYINTEEKGPLCSRGLLGLDKESLIETPFFQDNEGSAISKAAESFLEQLNHLRKLSFLPLHDKHKKGSSTLLFVVKS